MGLNFLRQTLISAAEAVQISSGGDRVGKVGPDNSRKGWKRTGAVLQNGWKENRRKLSFQNSEAIKTIFMLYNKLLNKLSHANAQIHSGSSQV